MTIVMTVFFDERGGFKALADDPVQERWYEERLAPALEGEPQWLDGHWRYAFEAAWGGGARHAADAGPAAGGASHLAPRTGSSRADGPTTMSRSRARLMPAYSTLRGRYSVVEPVDCQHDDGPLEALESGRPSSRRHHRSAHRSCQYPSLSADRSTCTG